MTTKTGKAMRLKRVIDPAGGSVICALDHGMTSPTFLEPLADIEERTRETVAGGANVIMMSKGMIRVAEPAFSPTTSLALLLSAASVTVATTFTVPADDDLIIGARAIVKGRVEAIETGLDERQSRVFTYITLRVEEARRGCVYAVGIVKKPPRCLKRIRDCGENDR